MTPVSVVINTLNEQEHLPGCLASLKWADEIVVVDMHSEDATPQIAKDFGCRLFQHERTGYVEPARNFALAQARNPWVLVVDADERVSSGLADWLATTLDSTSASGFRIPRRNLYGDRWITCCGWFPDSQLRLFRQDRTRYSDRIHRAPAIDGIILDLPDRGEAYFSHYCFATLESRVNKDNKYAAIAAQTIFEEGRRIGALGLLGRPLAAFLTAFFLQRGIFYGPLGASLAWERAFATFLKYAKLWELQQKHNSGE